MAGDERTFIFLAHDPFSGYSDKLVGDLLSELLTKNHGIWCGSTSVYSRGRQVFNSVFSFY